MAYEDETETISGYDVLLQDPNAGKREVLNCRKRITQRGELLEG
jgi:hypothetical protein